MARKPKQPLLENGALPRYAAYRRVSSPGQVEKDLSLPEQASQQRDFIRRNGGVVVAEFEDAGISGKNIKDRPAFQDMIQAAKEGKFDVLLVHASNRAFRNRHDAITSKTALKKLGIRLQSVTESWFGGSEPDDNLLEGFMECIDEWKLEELSRETKKGIRSAANHHGRQQGPPPFGYAWADLETPRSGWIVSDQYAVWVRRAFERILSGASLADVTREFNALRVPSPRAVLGRRRAAQGWSIPAVRYLITNRTYTGIVRYHDETFAGSHPAIIGADVFDQVQRVLAGRARGRCEASDALFAGGVLSCPLCRAEGRRSALTHVPYVNRKGERVRRYRCAAWAMHRERQGTGRQSAGACAGYGVNEDVVLAALKQALTAIAGGKRRVPKAPDLERLRGDSLKRSRDDAYVQQIAVAQRELETHPAVRERLTWQQKFVSREEFVAAFAALKAREAKLLAVIADAERGRRTEARLAAGEAAEIVAVLESDLPARQKRDVLRAFIEDIVPSADKRGVHIEFLASLA